MSLAGASSAAPALTFLFPLSVFIALVVWGFFVRKRS